MKEHEMKLTRRRWVWVASLLAGGATVPGGLIRAATTSAQDASPGASPSASPAATPAVTGEGIKVAFVYVGPIGDLGWTYAHDQGRLALERNIPGVETVYAESIPEQGPDGERVIRSFAQDGADIIFTTSFGFMDATINVAADFPETTFVHISGFKTAENVGTGFGKIEEPRYVSGLVAGAMSESGQLGYVAAFPIPEVIRGINAFTLGVREINPEATVQVVWTNTWFDPQLERQAAEALLDGGADVIAQHQDTPGPQQAAEERGKYGVGYDADMAPLAPAAVLTSAIWNWGGFYTDTVRQVIEGTWQSSQYWGGWEDGIVDLAPLGPMVPDDVRQSTEAAIAEFESGDQSISTIFTGPLTDQSGEVRVPAGETMTDEELLSMDWFVAGVQGAIPT